MTWNHRVIERKDGRDERFYSIHEVYYKNRKPNMATENAVGVCGDSLEELRETLHRMLRALDTPVLRWKGNKLVESNAEGSGESPGPLVGSKRSGSGD